MSIKNVGDGPFNYSEENPLDQLIGHSFEIVGTWESAEVSNSA